MRTFITKLCGPGESLVQDTVAEAAQEIDILPMSLFHFDAHQESQAELNSRLDGIIGGLSVGDTIILQTPIGMSSNYSKLLFAKLIDLQSAMGIKLVTIVENIFSEQENDLLNFYRHCDAVIAPGDLLIKHLQQIGISKKKLIQLPYYDFQPNMIITGKPRNATCLNYLNFESVPLPDEIKESGLSILIFQNQTFNNEGTLRYAGQTDDELLVNKVKQNGGWGLIWPADKKQEQFLQEIAPLALSIFISAGVPVIAKSNAAIASLIKEKQLGIVAANFEEAANKIKAIKDADYQNLLKNIAKMGLITRSGIATKNALISAVFRANLPEVKKDKNENLDD